MSHRSLVGHDSASRGTGARRRGSPDSGAPAPYPRAATRASETSSPTIMRRTGRNSSPLSTSRACQSWPAGSTRPRSKERPDLSAARSALGPCGIGNRWSSAGTSGHSRRISIAGQRSFTVLTLDGEPGWGWVRIPPDRLSSTGVIASGQTTTLREPAPRCDAPRWATDRPAQRRLLPICCLGRMIRVRPRPDRASDLGWS
jgi:hypothetical protein